LRADIRLSGRHRCVPFNHPSQVHARIIVVSVHAGLWLVLLEVTVIRGPAGHLVFDWHSIGIGLSGLSLVHGGPAALVYLPIWAITGFGLLMIVTHNALDGY